MSHAVLIDTDILSAWMKRDAVVIDHARRHAYSGGTIAISVITRFELVRGLKCKAATLQLTRIENWCQSSTLLDVTVPIADHAAAIHALLANLGQPIGDADTLIAATALETGRSLVTNNESHFSRVPNLVIENWLK